MKHAWLHTHDAYASGRQCLRCGAWQYGYCLTDGTEQWWWPAIKKHCKH